MGELLSTQSSVFNKKVEIKKNQRVFLRDFGNKIPNFLMLF